MPFKVSTAGSEDSITFEGFSRYKAGDKRIAVVTFEGTPELYSIDAGINPMVAVKGIRDMYLADYDRLPEFIYCYDHNGYPMKTETV